MSKKKNLTRREFFKDAAIAGAAVAAGRFVPETSASAQGAPTRWDKEADVVVVGAGCMGLPAAIQAAEAGASVTLVEANYDVGGTPSSAGEI